MRTLFRTVCLLIALPMFMFVSGCGPSGMPADQDTEESVSRESTGGTRPGSIPSDLPNVAGAGNFLWLSLGGSDLFSFEVSGKEYRAVCADQIALLGTAGWQLSSGGYEMDVDGALVKTLEKPGYTLMVTCGDNTEEGAAVKTISVALNRTKK